ncbi:MAG: TonB-dependent receptor, partial [Thermoanaerobaculia bacterium]
MRGSRIFVILAALVLLGALPALAQGGSIEGKVTRTNGKGLGGVTVVISELGSVEITDGSGGFRFNGVPAGSYTLSFSLGDHADTATVEVASGAAARVDQEVDWEVSFAETITVFSASRRRERIVEAPAAVTVITEQQIERESTHGQLPKLLANTPGAEVTQSGVYDFNFNTRGFNSSLNRRILVLLDGRDPSVTFLGSQEWASLTFALDNLANIELVRGPGSALYGADAYNGVLNITTKSPRDSTGGRVKLTGGELSTLRGDLSVSGGLGGDWYGRFVGGVSESDDYARSRNVTTEYAGLELEVIPLPQDRNEALFGNLRLDKFWGGKSLSLETGYSEFDAGGNAVTGIGRTQIITSERFHFKANFNTAHWNVLAYQNERESPVTSLRSGLPLFLDSDKTHGEIQGNVGFGGGKGRFIAGASYAEESFDSTLPGIGVQTLVFSKVDADYEGVFGQLEYDFSDKLRGVFSARWDDSNQFDSQVSPRVALVFSPSPSHNFRVHYSEAFQSPNYSEQFLQVNVAPPTTSLAGLEGAFCAPFGVSCGLGVVPVLGLGNPDIEVEEIETIEVGYSGVLGGKAFLTVDYYNNQMTNFITDLIPGFNPTLGLLNPAFGPYQAPSALPEPFK